MSSARFASAQETRPTIAVIKLDVASIGSNVGDMSSALADMITTELAKHPNVRVIDRVQVQDLLLKQKLLLSGRVSDEDALKAGKLLGANYLVMGSGVFAGGTARLDLRLTESETGLNSNEMKLSGKQDDLLTLVEQIATSFTKELKPVAIAHTEDAAMPATAVLDYSRGLDFEKRGKKTQAAQMYEKTLQISPNYEDAKQALARVK